jgi:hypothetical protein
MLGDIQQFLKKFDNEKKMKIQPNLDGNFKSD